MIARKKSSYIDIAVDMKPECLPKGNPRRMLLGPDQSQPQSSLNFSKEATEVNAIEKKGHYFHEKVQRPRPRGGNKSDLDKRKKARTTCTSNVDTVDA